MPIQWDTRKPMNWDTAFGLGVYTVVVIDILFILAWLYVYFID